jgi:hypothetical protein
LLAPHAIELGTAILTLFTNGVLLADPGLAARVATLQKRGAVVRISLAALGLAFCGGRETGEHMFPTQSQLQSALERIALDAGESVAAPERSPFANRREACRCAYGNDLSVRSDGLPDLPDCGPWRVKVLSELLAEDNVAALEWPAIHLRAEARRRDIDLPDPPRNGRQSLHVIS